MLRIGGASTIPGKQCLSACPIRFYHFIRNLFYLRHCRFVSHQFLFHRNRFRYYVLYRVFHCTTLWRKGITFGLNHYNNFHIFDT